MVCVYVFIHIYIYRERERERIEYYSAIKKNEMPFVATQMDLDIIILHEVRDEYMISLICGI